MSTATLPVHRCTVTQIGHCYIPDPLYGDMKLNVFPFKNTGRRVYLPDMFSLWDDTLNQILEHIPVLDAHNEHYVTIDSKFFTVDDFLRREGVHMDGNFCADPAFSHTTWGGTRTTWGGTIVEQPSPDPNVTKTSLM